MLYARLEDGQLRRTLGKLLDKIQNKLPLFTTWGRAVELEAKTNARAYGGRRIWRNIAGATRLHSITRDGAVVECGAPIETRMISPQRVIFLRNRKKFLKIFGCGA